MGGLSLDPKKAQEQSEKVARMRELTNADESTARFWLESYSWDLERVRDVGASKLISTHARNLVVIPP